MSVCSAANCSAVGSTSSVGLSGTGAACDCTTVSPPAVVECSEATLRRGLTVSLLAAFFAMLVATIPECVHRHALATTTCCRVLPRHTPVSQDASANAVLGQRRPYFSQ